MRSRKRSLHAYDALDRLSAVTTHPTPTAPLVTSYTLDGNGNTTARTTGDTVTTTYLYDALSRLLSVSAPGLATIGYGYDPRSQRTSMTDGTGTSSYSYDGLGRLTQAVQPSGTTAYGYDLDSDRTSLTYPGSQAVSYAFSNAGRLSSLTDWAGRTTSYTYKASGLAATVTLPATLGTLFTNYTYDRAQRLTSLTNVVGSTTVTSHDYTLDNEGDRTALAEYVSGITAVGGSDAFTMSYDGLLRLTAVALTNPESFTLDGASNITSRSGPSASYSYDGSDRLSADGAQSFTWSNADRLTVRGNDSFGYDALDRLTSSTVSGTARTYAYSGDGLLQSRTQGTSTSFLWDPASSPSRLLMQGSDKIVYGLGPLYAARADGSTVSFARDGGKSVRAEISSSGAVTSAFRYRAYGSLVQWTAPAPSYLGYAGQLVDGSGLLYMRARWYDPVTGRFVTPDPALGDVSTPAALGRFSYANANPVRYSDPTGYCVPFCLALAALLAPEGIAAITGAAAAVSMLAMRYGPSIASFAQRAAPTAQRLAEAVGSRMGRAAAAETALAKPIMVIGETSSRVEAFAERIGAETYVESEETAALSLGARAAANLDALAGWMERGGAIYDIGLDPARVERGFFYFVESGLGNVAQFPYWVRLTGIQ
jgi:RHS repeat-associated protein